MEREISHSWFYPHAPEVVWEYLTNPELLSQWLMENDFKPIIGHKFQFLTKPKIRLGFDGIINGEVMELIPLQKLSYTWNSGSLNSRVTWTLIAQEGGTELKLVHSGFTGMKNFLPYLIMNKGWQRIGKRILARINEKLQSHA